MIPGHWMCRNWLTNVCPGWFLLHTQTNTYIGSQNFYINCIYSSEWTMGTSTSIVISHILYVIFKSKWRVHLSCVMLLYIYIYIVLMALHKIVVTPGLTPWSYQCCAEPLIYKELLYIPNRGEPYMVPWKQTMLYLAHYPQCLLEIITSDLKTHHSGECVWE